MNKELLLKVKEQILAHPEELDMATWGECGSPCCIAGWVVRLSDRILTPEFPTETEDQVDADARKALGVVDRCPLFFWQDWPGDLRVSFLGPATPMRRAEVAAEAIDRYIEGRWR